MFHLRCLRLRASSLTLQLKEYSHKADRQATARKKELYGDLFPEKLLNKKMKTPAHLYIADARAAEMIDHSLRPHFKKSECNTILEMNPGIGLFTHKLLDQEEKFRKIILIESMEYFMPKWEEMHSLYPERVKVKHGDIIGLPKLVFQDKIDNGGRVEELLEELPRKPYEEDLNMAIFGTVGSYNFFKHLINSAIFQNSLLSMGRCEMYLVVPPPIYIHLTCYNDVGYMIYRSASMLFQMLFEHQFISHIPRDYFLPAQTEHNASKGSKLNRVKSINPEYLYLVKVVPRRLADLCAVEDLPALWYFVKQNCVSRRNRVIPNLEKWVPGCGPRLIVNTKQPEHVRPLFPDEDTKNLPKYSKPSTTMSYRDFFPNMNIYTQFGDLTPSQMLTLFTEFRHWPEYSESSFLASLENTMLKMETSAEEGVDGMVIAEEDDASSEMSSTVHEEATSGEALKSKRKKRL